MNLPKSWRGPFLCFLFANFCFVRVSNELGAYTEADSFFFAGPPPTTAYCALWTNILLWTVAGILLFRFFRRVGARPGVVNAIIFLVALLPLNATRDILAMRYPLLRAGLFTITGTWGAAALILSALLLFGILTWRYGLRLQSAAASLLLFATPVFAILLGMTVSRFLTRHPSEFQQPALQPFTATRTASANGTASPRVVWIVFDEMDYRLSFTERPRTLDMPEFDRLATESIHATDALTPANSTEDSIPALLHGGPVRLVRPLSPAIAGIRYADSDQLVQWNSSQTIFSTARTLGYNTAIVGWYLPYCRVLAGDLNECTWSAMGNRMNSTGATFIENLLNQNRTLVETSMLSPFGQSLTIRKRVRTITRILEQARRAVADPRLGFVYLHFPVPHPPPVYDRFRRTMTKANSPVSGYIDSLALADRILGDLRTEMQSSGLWDSTTLLVTADHSFRSSKALDGKYDPRVPYFLKLSSSSAGTAPAGTAYDKRFYTVRTRDLLTGILKGDLHDSNAVLTWMNR